MNDYTDTWAGHTIYTCLNVYLGPKRCLWKHPTFICQSFKFRLWIKHPPLTAKRISFLLFGLTFYRYARISSKFLRYVRARISQIWQWAARWNWHRSQPCVLFCRTHLGILKRFRGIHTQGPWQRSTSASFPSAFKHKLGCFKNRELEWNGDELGAIPGCQLWIQKDSQRFLSSPHHSRNSPSSCFYSPHNPRSCCGEADSDILTGSKLNKYVSIFVFVRNDIFRMILQLIVGDSNWLKYLLDNDWKGCPWEEVLVKKSEKDEEKWLQVGDWWAHSKQIMIQPPREKSRE